MIDDPANLPPEIHPYSPPNPAQAPAPRTRHSGMGIASFVIGLLASVATLAVFAYAGYAQVTTPGGISETSPVAMLIGLVILGCGGLLFLGLILGIAALFQSDRRRVFGVLGLLVNGVVLGGAAALIALGLSMPA